MKLVFAHDHVFKKDKFGNYYTAGSFNNEIWKRYLNHFDEVNVIARLDNKSIDFNNTYNDFNLPNCNFDPIPSLSSPISLFKNKSIARNKIISKLQEADALIARLPSEIGNLAIDIAKEMNKPYAVEVVACVWDALWNYGNLKAKVYAPLAMQKMKKRVFYSPFTLYVTNDFLQNRYPTIGKTISVSNVELPIISNDSLSKRFKKYRKDKKLFKIGMIGNLNNRIKGWDIAIKALSILNKNEVNIELHILGDGNINEWVDFAKKLGVHNNLVFHGVLPGGKRVLEWLDNIDIYIQPSFQEGLPRAIIEAMSRGCPVVGSTAGGIPELLDKSCLHKPGDFKMLAKIMQDILLNSELAKKLSRRNFEESKKFNKSILDRKRYNFWASFVNTYIKH